MADSLTSARASVPLVGVEGALREDALRIDLRSPAEHAADRLPGALCVPLFDDAERALVGTLYRRASPRAAFEAGREIVHQRVRELVREVGALAGEALEASDLEARVDALCAEGLEGLQARLATRRAGAAPERPVVLYCWRGGLRSRSVVLLLRSLGLGRAVALEGGYRAWRRHVLASLAAWRPPRAFVLRGLTGVGKTLVLRALERLRPGLTLDLEGLAGHRSSLLGMVGLEPLGQRAFESDLATRLARGFPGRLVVEGESRRVGDVTLPAAVWGAVHGGTAIELVAPLERRIAVLREDYLAGPRGRAELPQRLPHVEARMRKRVKAGTLTALWEAGRIDELVALLLDGYYDPLYRHSGSAYRPVARIDATDPERAAREVLALVDEPRAR